MRRCLWFPFLIVVLALAGPAEAQELGTPCPLSLEGPASIVRAIRARTDAIQVGSCRPLSARIRLLATKAYEVERLEGDRVVESRRVEEEATVVTLVVSWARAAWVQRSEPAPLVPSEAAPRAPDEVPPPGPPPAPAPAPAAEPDPALEPAPTASLADKPALLAIVARMGLTLASDASLWADITLGACGYIGFVCLGGYVRAPFDTLSVGPGRDLSTSRGGVDGLLGAELSFAFDRIAFRPGLAFGAGWLRASGGSVETTLVYRDAVVGRISAFAHLGVRLADIVWLEIGALADLGPGAPTKKETQAGVELAGFPLFRSGVDASFRLEVP